MRISGRALPTPLGILVWSGHDFRRRPPSGHCRIRARPASAHPTGNYVLHFLYGHRLVPRVDLKADHKHGRLLVRPAYMEAHTSGRAVADSLAHELRTLARRLNLEQVRVERRADFARDLGAAIRR